MSSRPKVLVIDDDIQLCEFLQAKFEELDFEVQARYSGREGIRAVRSFCPDIVVLDILMEDLDGKETFARIRQIRQCPVIFLTVLSDAESIAEGLMLGASDYVTKPFDVRELVARTRAILRRRQLVRERHESSFANETLVVDPLTRRTYKSGRWVNLSPTEYNLLIYLVRHAERAVPFDELLQSLADDPGVQGSPARLEYYIDRLRQKIEPDPAQPSYIRSVPGVGYEFTHARR